MTMSTHYINCERLVAVFIEFRKFSLSLVESFTFNGIILMVIALDAILIGIQASGYVAMKSGITS